MSPIMWYSVLIIPHMFLYSFIWGLANNPDPDKNIEVFFKIILMSFVWPFIDLLTVFVAICGAIYELCIYLYKLGDKWG